MIIWGFDPSKNSGFAIYDTARDRAAIVCGVLAMPEKADHYYTSEQIGLKVTALVKQYGRPDFAVLEEQIAASVRGTNADGMLYPWLATSGIVSTLGNFNVPYGTLLPATWRTMFFGERFDPPKKKVKRDGKITEKNDWKAPAMSECERLGIVLPSNKADADDAAEAAAIAICWRHKKMNFHARRHEKPWMDLCSLPDKAPSPRAKPAQVAA